jgi:hypothetical protein
MSRCKIHGPDAFSPPLSSLNGSKSEEIVMRSTTREAIAAAMRTHSQLLDNHIDVRNSGVCRKDDYLYSSICACDNFHHGYIGVTVQASCVR